MFSSPNNSVLHRRGGWQLWPWPPTPAVAVLGTVPALSPKNCVGKPSKIPPACRITPFPPNLGKPSKIPPACRIRPFPPNLGKPSKIPPACRITPFPPNLGKPSKIPPACRITPFPPNQSDDGELTAGSPK
uniref:Uncharacterized protein n=1 Tax=Malurus cyaneus samueli TaxID=2593467 RepID=A0A8C5X6G8_9PASS